MQQKLSWQQQRELPDNNSLSLAPLLPRAEMISCIPVIKQKTEGGLNRSRTFLKESIFVPLSKMTYFIPCYVYQKHSYSPMDVPRIWQTSDKETSLLRCVYSLPEHKHKITTR